MLSKPLAFFKQNQTTVVITIGLLFIGYCFMQYSGNKNLVLDNMNGSKRPLSHATPTGPEGSPVTDDAQLDGAPIDFQVSNKASNVASCTKESVIDAAELLPKGSDWDVNMPQNVDISVLEPGNIIGMSSQTLRNANLQIRSEPANPQMEIGPWNQTTIAPDDSRRPMEIGCGSQ